MTLDRRVFKEACLKLHQGESPVSVVRFVAARGGELLDVSNVLMHCGLSLTVTKRAIDDSGLWPSGAAFEDAFHKFLETWDPSSEDH